MANVISPAADDDGTNKDIVDPKTGEPRKKPIADAQEARSLAKRYFDDRKKMNENFGEIRLKFDGEPPQKVGHYRALGQGWRSNTSRKAMTVAVQRRTPILIQFIDGLRYLTASSLPDTTAKQQIAQPAPDADPNAVPSAFAAPSPVPTPSPQEKTDIFRRKMTGLIRGWNGWRPLMYQIGNHDILFGHIVAACLDDVEWRPQAFPFDQFAAQSKASHDVTEWPAVVFRKTFAIHELVTLIQDREAAESAGWNVDNVTEAINKSMPVDKQSRESSATLRYADMIRDGNLAQSCKDDAKGVETYVVYYPEYSGKVSQYIVLKEAGEDKDLKDKDDPALFYSEEKFESMAHIVAAFSIQHGNGDFYGSIGSGRELYGLNRGMDITYNRILDLAYMMSLMRVPDDKSNRNMAPFTMDGVFMRVNVPADAKMEPYEGNISSLIEVVNLLKEAIAELSNAYLPNMPNDGEPSTATEILDNARKENLVTGDTLARFYGQFCLLIEMIQRRVCSRDNIKAAVKFLKKEQAGKTLLPADEYAFYEEMRDKEDTSELYAKYELPGHLDKDAVMLCVDLLREGLEPLDIYRLSRSPANEPMGDTPDTMRQKLLQAYPMFQANPAIDQYAFLKMVLGASLSPQIADEIILPPNANETAADAQKRNQVLELAAMQSLGIAPAVLPGDDDVAHSAVLKAGLSTIPPDPQIIAANPIKHQSLSLMSQHLDAHMAARKQKGEKGEQFAQDDDVASHYGALLNKADQLVAAQAQQQQGAPAALPAPQPQQ